MIKIVLLSFIIIISYLVFSKKATLNIQEHFKEKAMTIEYEESGLESLSDFLGDENLKVYKRKIGRGTPIPGGEAGAGVELDVAYGLKVEDVKSTFPNAVQKDGQIEYVSGESLAALAIAICKETYDNVTRIEDEVNTLKSDVYKLETKDAPKELKKENS